MENLKAKIRSQLDAYKENLVEDEPECNFAIFAAAEGFKAGLELCLNKEILEEIFGEYPELFDLD